MFSRSKEDDLLKGYPILFWKILIVCWAIRCAKKHSKMPSQQLEMRHRRNCWTLISRILNGPEIFILAAQKKLWNYLRYSRVIFPHMIFASLHPISSSSELNLFCRRTRCTLLSIDALNINGHLRWLSDVSKIDSDSRRTSHLFDFWYLMWDTALRSVEYLKKIDFTGEIHNRDFTLDSSYPISSHLYYLLLTYLSLVWLEMRLTSEPSYLL